MNRLLSTVSSPSKQHKQILTINRRSLKTRPYLLYIATFWPQKPASASGVRSESIIQICQSNGWDVGFLCNEDLSRSKRIEELGVDIFSVWMMVF